MPGYEGDELFDPALLKELAAAISAEDVQLYYQTAILGRRDLPFAPDPRTGFEMTLVRMLAFRPAGGAAATSLPVAAARARQRAGASAAAPSTAVAAIVRPASAGPIDPVQWSRVIGDLDVSGAARQLATNCALLEHRGNTLQARGRSEGRAHAAAGREACAGAGKISRRPREARVRRRRAAGRNPGADTASGVRRKRSMRRAARSKKIPRCAK